MRSGVWGTVAAGILFCACAQAEISGETISQYNSAVQSGDVAQLLPAAEALADEAIASPGQDDAALLAYEAAWALCRNHQCEKAIPAAEFAAAQPDTGAHPSAADRGLLVAFAKWKTSPDAATRGALDSQLDGRVGDPPSLLTVSAFHERYLSDLTSGDGERAEKTARAAADHFRPARGQVGRLWSGAELAVQTSIFNDRHAPGALVGMANLNHELAVMRHVTPDRPDWLNERYYTTEAWMSAMNAYFASEDEAEAEREQAREISSSDITSEDHTHPSGPSVHDDDAELPSCPGEFNRLPRPSYPDGAADDGYVGAVITLIDIDERGRLEPRIGAAVPSDIFNKAALTSLKHLRWKWEEAEPDDPPCRKTIEGLVYPFEFLLDR